MITQEPNEVEKSEKNEENEEENEEKQEKIVEKQEIEEKQVEIDEKQEEIDEKPHLIDSQEQFIDIPSVSTPATKTMKSINVSVVDSIFDNVKQSVSSVIIKNACFSNAF